jgi:hypothetical protein
MSKVLRTVSKIAGTVAAISAVVLGPVNPVTVIAAAVATVAGIGAQLTAPKPVPKGSVTNVIIDAEPPRPYMIGESYSAGVLRHRVGYGPTLKKVPNPFLWEVKVFSGVGPVEALVEEQFDFEPIGSYYSGFYSSVSQLGLRPQTAALVPPLNSPATGWGSASKLSGCAAIGGNYKFDKEGKVFASGTPLHGAIWRGEKVYDPRLDSTYPGGSGPHRLGNESTYTYSANPALHAGTYAFGRYQNGIKVFGLGLAEDGIDWPAIVDWANLCEANEWEAHGTIYEGGRGANVQEQRLRNLDDICAAGGGRWLIAGAVLSFDWHRPRVSLATLTDDDLLEEGGSATAVQSLRDRMNGVRPQYISPLHNWEQITADEIIGTTYRTEDGQPLTQTWALNLVKDAEQAGELASYALVDSREIGPIELNAKADWRFYRPGETITIDSELLGYDGPAVIVQRDLDPSTFAVRLTLKGETPAKHDFALGKVANPPPTPVIGQTQQQRDGVSAEALNPPGFRTIEIAGSYTTGLAGNITQTHIGGGQVEVDIPSHGRRYTSGRTVTVSAATITLPETSTRLIYYDDPELDGGTVTLQATTDAADAYFSDANPDRHFIAIVTTVDSGGGGGGAGGSGPPGGGGWNGTPGTEIP